MSCSFPAARRGYPAAQDRVSEWYDAPSRVTNARARRPSGPSLPSSSRSKTATRVFGAPSLARTLVPREQQRCSGEVTKMRLTAVLHALLVIAVAILTHRRQSTVDVRPRPIEGETDAFAARLAARVATAKERHLETLGLLIREETVAIDGEDGPELPAESLQALLRCHRVLETR